MKKITALFVFCLLLSSFGYAWQQRVSYVIAVQLDTIGHRLMGVERLRYWNNSPDTLKYVWFHLYPNAYRDISSSLTKDADRYHDYRGHDIRSKDRGFIDIGSFKVDSIPTTCTYGDDSTEARVLLPIDLAPNQNIDFTITFTVKLPIIISRLGHEKTHYEISQWYPKIVVYDEKGWHPDGYHYIGEFYGDYGSFNVGITTPKGMKVGATGVEIIDTSDADSSNNAAADNDSTEYHLFCAENVHDFAWCADAKYVVTEELHDGVLIKVLALPRDSLKWKNVMQYSKDALDYYGKWYGKYPYLTLTVCDGSMAAGGGMEYPNLVIISSGEDKYTRLLENVVMHEIGHQWFYGMLGDNEMDEAWLDEGVNSFSEERYFEEKYGPVGNLLAKPRANRMFPEMTDRYFGRLQYYMFAASKMEQPIMTKACLVREPALYAEIAYKKPALLMWWLKDYLGDVPFDKVMQAYFTKYQFKHVTTEKFLAVIDSVAHKDVRPYFMPMLTTTGRCDYAIKSVKRVKEQRNMYQIRLQRRDSLVLPVALRLEDNIDKRYTVNWSGKGKDTTFYLQSDAALRAAMLDPDTALPETNRFNNHWPRQWSFTLLPRLPSPDRYQIYCVPFPWYDAVNGAQLRAYLHGGRMMDGGPLLGRHQWTFMPYWGFKAREFSFSFDYQTPVTGLPMPPRAYLSLGRAFDVEWARIGARRGWGQWLMDPSERFNLNLEYRRVSRVDRFWDPRDIEQGRTFILTAERGFASTSYRVASQFRAAASAGLITEPQLDIDNFIRAEAEEKATLRLARWLRPRVRAFAGYIAGAAPAQEQYFLSGGFRTAGFEDLIISYKGWWSAQERYHVDGGANLPGYLGRHLRGNTVVALNVDLPLRNTPLSLFAGAGQVAGGWAALTANDVLTDAGVALHLPFLRLLFPLWINRPLPGKHRFDWRWQVSVGGSIAI